MSEAKQIPLSRGLFATVDAADYEWLSQWKWSALKVGRKNAPVRYYAVRMEKRGEASGKPKMILMHRLIAGATAGEKCDHRDLDTLNDRRSNLRRCTQGQNSLNHRGHRDRQSRFKGVYRHKQNRKWIAEFRGKYLGSFGTDEKAAFAYDAAALAYSPDFSLLIVDMGA